MKLIFLDIDGVIAIHKIDPNSDTGMLPGLEDCDEHHFSKSRLENLAWIVRETQAKIVLSSDWRLNSESLEIVREKLRSVDLDLIGTTENQTLAMSWDISRFRQICNFVKIHKPEKFVVIDDINFGVLFNPHVIVHCEPWEGLTVEKARRAISLLST